MSDQMDRTSLQLVPTHLLRWTPPYALYIFSCCNHNFHIYPKDQNNPTRGVFLSFERVKLGGDWTVRRCVKTENRLSPPLRVADDTRTRFIGPPPSPPRISLHSAPPFSPDNFYLVLLKNIVRFCCHVHMDLKLMLSTLHIQSEDLELFRKQHWCTRMYEGFIS